MLHVEKRNRKKNPITAKKKKSTERDRNASNSNAPEVGMEGSSQHGEWGAARAVPPEDGVGEGEPPRRGGHERAHEHPLHGAAALREERRCARASQRWYPRRR